MSMCCSRPYCLGIDLPIIFFLLLGLWSFVFCIGIDLPINFLSFCKDSDCFQTGFFLFFSIAWVLCRGFLFLYNAYVCVRACLPLLGHQIQIITWLLCCFFFSFSILTKASFRSRSLCIYAYNVTTWKSNTIATYILRWYLKYLNLSRYYFNQTMEIILAYVDQCDALFVSCLNYIIDLLVGIRLMPCVLFFLICLMFIDRPDLLAHQIEFGTDAIQ